MTISPETLLEPRGELTTAMFGMDADALREFLEAWLEDGYDKASEYDPGNIDAAARAWAHYRGFTYRAVQLANLPGSFTITDGVQQTITNDQRSTIQARADYWLGVFDGYSTAGDPPTSGIAPPSGSSKTTTTWGGTRRGEGA